MSPLTGTGNEWLPDNESSLVRVAAMRKAVRSTLRSGGVAFGTWVRWCRTPAIMQVLRSAGLEFAFIDTQHSGLSIETLGDMCHLARECGVVPLVRPYEHSRGVTVRLRDVGAMGLIVPGVESPQQVRSLWEWLDDEYHDSEFLMCIQIESPAAVARIDEILSGGKVDVVWIGRHDLSASLGLPAHESVRHPRVLEAVDTIASACRRNGVAIAAGAYSYEDAQDMMAKGAQWLSWGSDEGVLHAALRDASVQLHKLAIAGGGVRARD